MNTVIISPENRADENGRERLARVKRAILANAGADLYMLPELWITGFFSYGKYIEAAEPVDGETISALSDAARETGAYIFTGSIVEKRGGKLYNTAVLLDRSGNIAGRYSKVHLFGGERELMTPGSAYSVCDTEFGRAGFSICYDLRFPEQYRRMVDMGAEIFLNCSAWPLSRLGHWDILNQARAIENQAVWLSCCSRGEDSGTRLAGVSYAVEPDGTVILKSKSEISRVKINAEKAGEYRASFPALADRV